MKLKFTVLAPAILALALAATPLPAGAKETLSPGWDAVASQAQPASGPVSEADAAMAAVGVTASEEGSATAQANAEGPSAAAPLTPMAEADASVVVHVGDLGWRPAVSGGRVAGTTGNGLSVEALTMSLVGVDDASSTIEYRAWVAERGWQSWASSPSAAGTTGDARAIEALQVRLAGPIATRHDVYYQVHVATVGWMPLAKNADPAGALNHGLPIEALRVWVVEKGGSAPEGSEVAASASGYATTGLAVRAHVAGVGWRAPVGDGVVAGTTGQGRAIEALSLSVDGLPVSGGIAYAAHVAGVGWQAEVSNGAVAGTTGQGRAIEAVRLTLTDDLAASYDLYYRVHVANVGWLSWAKNGEDAGSTGLSLAVEALQVRLVSKEGGEAPTASDASFDHAFVGPTGVAYAAHVQNVGWQGEVKNGAVAGLTGQGLRLECLTATVDPGAAGLPGTISYRAHVQDVGWQPWQANGSKAGTEGAGRRVEALEFSLSGQAAGVYDVWYRTHVEDFGWLGWAKGGETSGSTGISKRVEAVELRLMPKASGAPGPTTRRYIGPDYYWDGMTRRAQGYSSPTGQLILADLSAHVVGIYENSAGYWRRIRYFPCSSGAPSSPTVRGVFHVGSRGYVFGSGFSCYYWTQFYGAYLFHSVLYQQGTRNIQDGRLGMSISHGCIRLAIGDAQYIYENIRSGTTVVVYS